MRSFEDLVAAVRIEAESSPFPIDEPVYQSNGFESPTEPVLCAGSLEAPLAVLGRDLGKDEVAARQPLIGAGGRLVREGVHRARIGPPPSKAQDKTLEAVLDHVLLTNTVPYKPPGNKAYPERVKARFRPFVAELLAVHSRASAVITLGTEAFKWFAPYAEPGAMDAFWEREDRYEATLDVEIKLDGPDGPVAKGLRVLPLPHPSPLNQRWYAQFPGLLDKRMAEVSELITNNRYSL